MYIVPVFRVSADFGTFFRVFLPVLAAITAIGENADFQVLYLYTFPNIKVQVEKSREIHYNIIHNIGIR